MAPGPPRAAIGRVPLALPTLALGAGAWLGLHAAAAHAWLPLPLAVLAACRPGARLWIGSLLLGLLLGRESRLRHEGPPALARLETPAVHVLEGTVSSVDLPAWGAQRFRLRLESIGEPPVRLAPAPTWHVTVRLTGRGDWRWHDLVPGSRVRLLASVKRRRDGLRAVVTHRRGLTVLVRGEGLAAELARHRRRATWAFARGLSRRDAGLARALVLGDRGRLDRRDRELFRGTGQAHLLAVSGLHVGLLVGGFVLVLRVLGFGLRTTWVAAIVVAALYVPFTGAPPSAIRAGVGSILWCLGALLARAPRGLAVLVLVALLVLCADPMHLRSVSFQLSFCAVASILLLAPRLRHLLVGEAVTIPRVLAPKRAPVRSALAVSLAAWLGTAPLVAGHIGRLVLVGPLLAVPAVPLTALLLGSGCLLALGRELPALGGPAAWCFTQTAAVLRGMLALARDAHLGALGTRTPTIAWGVLYLTAFVLAARGGARVLRCALGAMGALLLVLLLPWSLPALSRAADPSGTDRSYDASPVTLADLPPPEPTPPGLPILPLALLALAAFAVLAVRLRWLRPGGAAAAWVLGAAAAAAFGAPGLAGLFAPFLVATLLGKLPGAERAGARSLRQVLCNGLPAFVGAVLVLSGQPAVGTAVFLGALACLGADTCATEIGVRYGGRPFRLVGKGPIAAGESGGVTLAGLLASVAGGALAPAAFLALEGWDAIAVLLVTTAGFAAALLDSVLGATLQFRGRRDPAGPITETVGPGVTHVRGWRWLDNDAVNLVAGAAGAWLALALLALR